VHAGEADTQQRRAATSRVEQGEGWKLKKISQNSSISRQKKRVGGMVGLPFVL
jgi:hypothetical protein